jgi:hypothetical protein
MRSLSRTRGTGVLSTVISAPESTLGVDQLTTVDELIELFHRDLLDQVGVFDDQGRWQKLVHSVVPLTQINDQEAP